MLELEGLEIKFVVLKIIRRFSQLQGYRQLPSLLIVVRLSLIGSSTLMIKRRRAG